MTDHAFVKRHSPPSNIAKVALARLFTIEHLSELVVGLACLNAGEDNAANTGMIANVLHRTVKRARKHLA